MDDNKNKESANSKEMQHGSPLSAVVRESFRIPVKEEGNFSVVLDGMHYSLTDIGVRGVCINLNSSDVFSSGQRLSGCELHFPDQEIKELDALVVHCSPGRKGSWLYGIEWQNLSSDTKNRINSIVNSLKNQIFEK